MLILGFSGILGMGIGALAFLTAINLIGPAKTATLTAATPVFGLVMAVLFLKEKPTPPLLAGVALCVTGVWLVL